MNKMMKTKGQPDACYKAVLFHTHVTPNLKIYTVQKIHSLSLTLYDIWNYAASLNKLRVESHSLKQV